MVLVLIGRVAGEKAEDPVVCRNISRNEMNKIIFTKISVKISHKRGKLLIFNLHL